MATEQFTGAEIVIKALKDQGVDTVFGYPGGAVLPIYDAIFKQNDIKHVLVRQEGGAVHAAEGYARSTGKVGVVLVTSGPGATNAVTGLTDALLDSIPLICLTGQVPTHLIGNDAFQEADTTGITRPCTKHNYLVRDIETLSRTMHEAFYVAQNGRPGPVVIDLPKDVQQGKIDSYLAPEDVKHRSYRPQINGEVDHINEAMELIANAKRPIFYVGGGVINSGSSASTVLTELVRLTGAPCTTTLMGLGAYPGTDKQFVGMLGMHGTYEANLAMYNCDVMINVGARFDDRITGVIDEFSPDSKKIHIDIDASSINKNVMVDIPIVGDAGRVVEEMLRIWKEKKYSLDKKSLKAWWGRIDEWRAKDCLGYTQDGPIIKPQHAIKRLYELTKDRKPYITTEVGQHQMWAAQYFHFDEPKKWMTSGGLGTMGYGLPAAVGAQLAHREDLVIDISGEASFMMNMQELGTIAQYRLPVKIFVVNNQWMGMVRQWQQLLHGNRHSESYSDALPDLVKLAESFGLKGMRCEKAEDLDRMIQEMIDCPEPVIFDCQVAKEENCYPMIPSGAAHYEMLLGPEDTAAKPISEEGMVLV
ncbi:acetolactate synthase [Kiloniella litopenaei]|uniref:Acetolactate synthase n=1 Tax=Kiloniella litopenaei TaxID=1549748 RepID=A0A0M2R7L1_9PROT|nr:acetolactate synthase 3 large subunit [Kiloniella litopenaei]KKJ76010.1 acetolactate synthase [Kiloniella litopenaei]